MTTFKIPQHCKNYCRIQLNKMEHNSENIDLIVHHEVIEHLYVPILVGKKEI